MADQVDIVKSADNLGVRHSPRLKARRAVGANGNQKTYDDDKKKTAKVVAQTGKTWGRSKDIGILMILGSIGIMTICPLIAVFFMISCNHYQCEAVAPLLDLWKWINVGDWSTAFSYFPRPTAQAFALYFSWLVFQGVLYAVMPAKIGYGQKTPAGYILPYVVNGLRNWVLTHILFVAFSWGLNLFDPAIIHDNWNGLFVVANVYGYFLTVFAYVKAHLFPSHPEDRKFSGSKMYDLFMGIEFNPRFGKWWDFKLFHNGRPGITAWTLINLSFAAAQYRNLGYVTNSMVLLNILHATYVVDFFYNEDWYLRTIDINHEHFGFYLAWGDSVWLPFMYTFQSHFLVRNPVQLPWWYFTLVAALGASGYAIFRAVNNQKDLVRKTNGNCKIWGKPATFVRTEYVTSDGKKHQSLLLTSGFWGISRHFNYVGDLMMSLAMCMTCGVTHLLPYFYIIYMTWLLCDRIVRIDARCSGKYGKYWTQYTKAVPYKLIPYIF